MNLQQTIWSIADILHKAPADTDKVNEIALVFAWKYVSDHRPEMKLPSLADVSNGVISLADAYRDLDRQVGEDFRGYATSVLPKVLPESEAQYFIREVEKTAEFDAKELIATLYRLVSKYSKHELTIPECLINLMISLSKIDSNDVYAPFASSIQLAVEARANQSHVIYQSEKLSSLAEAAILISGVELLKVDPLFFPLVIDGEIREFPNVLMIPPFGRSVKERVSDHFKRFSQSNLNGDVLALEHGLSQCSGRMVALVPQGFLFRGAHDYDLRVKLIGRGYVEAVIQLPSPIFIQSTVATAILVLDKNRDPDAPVMFYDADKPELIDESGRGRPLVLSGCKQIADDILNRNESPFCAFMNREEIEKNKYDLSVRRYVLGEASLGIRGLSSTKSLVKVAELIRGQLLKEDKSSQGDLFYEVGVKDINSDGFISEPEKCLRLSGRMRDRAELQRLQLGDILLVTKGSVGKVGIVGPGCGENWVASQSFQVVRLTHARFIEAPEYLYMYLSSKLVQAYLLEQVTGTTIPVVKTGDIKELPVPIMTKEEQKKVVMTRNRMLESYENIRALQNKIESMHNKHWSLS